MNLEHALPRRRAAFSRPVQARPRPARVREKDRDPYDGLRPWSAITHGAGAVLALAGTVLLLLRCAALSLSGWHVVSFLVYGVSMVGLYTASTLYHCCNVSVKGRIALRKYDHASIYFLIAGTYTPICLVALRNDGAWGWGLLGVIWGLALAGLVLTLAWISSPRWLTAGIYIFMGWLCLAALVPLLRVLPPPDSSGRWAAASSTPWAACSTPSSGRAGTTPASAVTRSSTSLSCWAPCSTTCSCTGWWPSCNPQTASAPAVLPGGGGCFAYASPERGGCSGRGPIAATQRLMGVPSL